MKAEGTFLRCGDFSKDFFTRRDSNHWVMVEIDKPVRILKHQHVVVCKVGDVEEGFASRLDAKDCVTLCMARCGQDGDCSVEDLVAVLVDHKIGLKGVE